MKHKQNFKTIYRSILIVIVAFLIIQVAGVGIFADPYTESAVQSEFSIRYDEYHSKGTVSIISKSGDEAITINSIELPDGQIIDGSTATYETEKNETLKIIVHYTVKIEEKVEIKKESKEEVKVEEKEEVEEKNKTMAKEAPAGTDGVKPTEPVYETKVNYEQREKKFTYEITDILGKVLVPEEPKVDTEISDSSIGESTFDDTESSTGGSSDEVLDAPRAVNGWYDDPGTSNSYYVNAAAGRIDLYKTTGGDSAVNLVIPSTLGGITIKQILRDVFSNYSYPNNIIIESIFLPKTIEYVGSGAFEGASNLKKLTIEDGANITLDMQAFSFSGTTAGNFEIVYPTTGSVITGYGTFSSSAMEIVEVPKVLTMGENCFTGIKNLKKIIIDEGVKAISKTAFANSTGGSSDAANGIELINNSTVLESIGIRAFEAIALSNIVTLPNSLVSIGDNAFSRCGLPYLDIPDTTTSIGKDIIYGEVSERFNPVRFPMDRTQASISFFPDLIGMNMNLVTPPSGYTIDAATRTLTATSGTPIPGDFYYTYGKTNSSILIKGMAPSRLTFHLNNGEPDIIEYYTALKIYKNVDLVNRFYNIYPGHSIVDFYSDAAMTNVIRGDIRVFNSIVDVYIKWRSTVVSIPVNFKGGIPVDPDAEPFVKYDMSKQIGFTYSDLPILQPKENYQYSWIYYYGTPEYPSPILDNGSYYSTNDAINSWGMQVEAVWTQVSSTYTFDANTGEFADGTNLYTEHLGIGTLLKDAKIPKISHPKGYKFDGWYTDKTYTKKAVFERYFDPIKGAWIEADTVGTENKTLFAKWVWDETVQDPMALVKIPTAIELQNDADNRNALGQGDFTLIRDPENEVWWNGKSVVIRTEPNVYLRKTGGDSTDYYDVKLYKDDGNQYTDQNATLVNLIPNTKDTSTIQLKTKINGAHTMGIFEGIMNFRISLE